MTSNQPKSGLQSTEFWTTVLYNVLSLLAVLGVLKFTDDQLTNIAASIAVIVVAVFNAYSTVSYTKARTDLKLQCLQNEQPTEPQS